MKIRTKVGLKFHALQRTLETSVHELNYLFWECTLRCNLTCKHCGSECISASGVDDMPAADFISAVKGISKKVNPNKTMIVITGGEPLLRKDLEFIGNQLYSWGFPWGFVTNGQLLSQNRLEALLQAGLRSVTISLDGMKKNHEWMRGNNSSFEQVCKAITLCTEIPDLVFDVVTCVNGQNFHDLTEIKKLLISLGVVRWRLFPIFPKGRAKDSKEMQLTNTQYREMLDFIKTCREEGCITASHSCEGYVGEYENEVRDSFFFCRAGITIGSILVDGSVSACPSLRGDYIQGSIYKDDFMHIWENRFQVMRDRSWTKTGECAECKEFKYCNGNGLHLRDEKSGTLFKCHYKMLINETSSQL